MSVTGTGFTSQIVGVAAAGFDPSYQHQTRRHDWDSIAAAAVDACGQWVEVQGPFNSSAVTKVAGGTFRAMRPSGSFEAVGRGSDFENSTVQTLFVRHLGADS